METENKILELYPMNQETLSNSIPVTAPPASSTPSTLNSRGTFSYLLLKRDMLKATYSTLVQQYELMKIEETKDEIAFQVIDHAIPPTVRIAPQMRKDLIRSFFTALLFCVGVVYVSERYFFPSKQEKEESKKEQEEEQLKPSIRKLSQISY